MENATKALLIAGSVLIAILLIAMGVKIFNSTSETTQSSQAVMDTTAITTFNSQFTPYIGNNKTSGEVKALVEKVIASNAVNDENKQITLYWQGFPKNSAAQLSSIRSELSSGEYKYIISISDKSYNNEGYLVRLYIT